MPCPRPELLLNYNSNRELFEAFEEIFLGGPNAPAPSVIHSPCGHEIHIRNHHFFHMVGMEHRDRPGDRLTIEHNAPDIFALKRGFGNYIHDGQRAIYLRAAALTLWEPDEIWENPELKSAKWVYFKEFDQKPYTHFVFLVGNSTEKRHNKVEIVPYTCMPMKASRGNKKRVGTRLYPLETPTPPLKAAPDTREDFTR